MNFELAQERRMLADMLHRFVAEQYPFAVRQRHAESPLGYDAQFWSRYGELGAIAALFGPDEGGLGGTGFDISVVFESLGRGLVVEPFLGALMAGSVIASAGTAAQQQWLDRVMAGQAVAAFAHGEPESRYEMSRVATRAQRVENGWVLNGAKAVVTQGEHADVFVISARSAGQDDDEDGISLFLAPAGTPGLALRGYPVMDGGRAAEMVLADVRLGPEALLGQPGAGLALVEQATARGLVALCAESVGAMDAARDATLEYLRTRRQFGAALGSFQALQHRMADLVLEIEQARSAVINAAAALDSAHESHGKRALSAAKYTIGRVGALVAEECIQLHGGIGMTWELPLAHYAKRLIMIDHELGDEDHHLQRYIALGQS